MNNNLIATVLGAGGFIGRYCVRNLTKKNYRCIIPTRNSYQKGYLKTQAPPGAIEFIKWDSKNFSKIKEAIDNSDIVINLIGILYETRKQKFQEIHSSIPDIISKMCSESNVKKFIHLSAIGASAESSSLYQQTKFDGEIKALNNFKNTIIVRPSVVCGNEDNFTNLFAKLSFLPVIPLAGKNYNFQPVLVTDVADAIIKIIDTKNNEGKIYEIGGPKIISFGNIVRSVLKTINKKTIVFEMPKFLAEIQATIFGMLPKPILTTDQLKILSESDNIVSGQHLTLDDLKIKPIDVENSMNKWLWRFRDGGEFADKKN